MFRRNESKKMGKQIKHLHKQIQGIGGWACLWWVEKRKSGVILFTKRVGVFIERGMFNGFWHVKLDRLLLETAGRVRKWKPKNDLRSATTFGNDGQLRIAQ